MVNMIRTCFLSNIDIIKTKALGSIVYAHSTLSNNIIFLDTGWELERRNILK